MIEQIKQKAKEMHDKVTKTTPLERSLLDATSNENWTTPNKILSEIGDATYNYQEFSAVMRFIWERLMEQKNKNWRKTFKVLYLIEYLLKNGAPRCIGEFKDEIYQIRTLNDYQFYESSIDRGEAIREKAKAIVELINDNQLLEQEREQAKKIRERLSGVGSMSSDVDGGRYGGQSYKNNNDYNSNVTPNYTGQGSSTNKDKKPQPYQGSTLDNNGKYDDYEFKGSLDKYKTKETNPTISPTKVEQKLEIKENKKPVQSSALLKLPKPGEKGSLEISKLNQNQQVVQPQNPQQKQGGASLIDFEDEDEQPVKQMQQIQYVQQVQQVQQKPQNQQNDEWDNQEWNWSTGNDQNQPKQQQPPVQQNIQPQQTQAQQQPIQQNINQLNDIFIVKSPQQLQQQANILQQNPYSQQQLMNDLFMMKSPQQYQQQANQLQQNTQYQQQNQNNQNQFQQNNQNNFYQQNNTQNNQFQKNSYQQQQPQNTSYQPQNKLNPPQQQKNDDFDQFQDFQGQQNQKKAQKPKVFNEAEMNLVNLTDLKNDPSVQKKEQLPISNDFNGPYSNNNPRLLYTTQDELDMFSMSPNKVQGINYNQTQTNNNMNLGYNDMGMHGGQGYNMNQGHNNIWQNQQQQQQYNNNMQYNQFNQQQYQQGYGYNQGRR